KGVTPPSATPPTLEDASSSGSAPVVPPSHRPSLGAAFAVRGPGEGLQRKRPTTDDGKLESSS
ncbi:MAG: hypothetical protein KC636_20660, partial [Myxococcales bacterium]|nr:hypothetical protein [Myxococcales bacterium]